MLFVLRCYDLSKVTSPVAVSKWRRSAVYCVNEFICLINNTKGRKGGGIMFQQQLVSLLKKSTSFSLVWLHATALTLSWTCVSSGGTRRIQSQYQPCKQLPEEDVASQCAVAPLWLPLLLLYIGLQFVAGHLPQQEGEKDSPRLFHIHTTADADLLANWWFPSNVAVAP